MVSLVPRANGRPTITRWRACIIGITTAHSEKLSAHREEEAERSHGGGYEDEHVTLLPRGEYPDPHTDTTILFGLKTMHETKRESLAVVKQTTLGLGARSYNGSCFPSCLQTPRDRRVSLPETAS